MGVYMCVCTYGCVFMCVHVWVCVHVCVNIWVFVHVWVFVCVCVCVCVCVLKTEHFTIGHDARTALLCVMLMSPSMR